MKNLLITGGTGFFGRAILRHLHFEMMVRGKLIFDEVTILSRYPELFQLKYPSLANLPWVRMHTGDVLKPRTLPQHLNFNSIIHAASDSTYVTGVTPLIIYRQIVEGTENILKFAVACNAKRFLFTSSGASYGTQPLDMEKIAETYNAMPDPLSPFNAYGVGKRTAEHLCSQYSHQYGIETIIARCFAFVGEDLPKDAHFAIGNFIRDALEKPEIIVNGDGKTVRSYMHQSDLAKWLITMLLYGSSRNAYNVGSEEEISIGEVASMVRDTLSPNKLVNINNMISDEIGQRSRYIPDITKAKKDLQLNIEISLKEAIKLSAGDKFNLNN